MHMANWKERGEVPDSDDDDDLDLESQPLSDTREQPASTPRSDAEHNLDDAIQNEGADEDDETQGGTSNFPQNTLEDGGDLLAQDEPPSKSKIENRRASPPPSLDSPKAFRFPLAFPDLDDDTEGTLSDHEPEQVDQAKAAEPAVNDEISQSYVRITSPSLSPLTVLSSSQESRKNEQNIFSQNGRPAVSITEEPTRDVQMDPTMGQNTSLATPAPPNMYRRTFRQRNPIQLHPYVLEQEKYRRTFTSRGMTPMRLAQIQEEKNKKAPHTSSPEPDSQEMDFEMEESQQLDLDWDPPSSPPVPQPSQNAGEQGIPSNAPSVGSDDEFPDIDELLRAPIPGPRQLGPKRRVKTYSSKPQRPPLSRIETQISRNTPNASNIFDVPASPPQTSSPVAAPSRHARKSLSRTLSLSSKEATPTWLGQNESRFDMGADLPTPATSAIKPISDPVVIESESELDDPFATDNDLSAAAASSSDESIQLRRVGKKIRGVLPASHLRLDQPRKKPAAPSRTQRVSLSLSPIKLPARRGVALARTSTTAGSPSTATHTGMHFLSDDSDDDGNDNNGFVMEDDRGNELDQLFQREGSAEEEDRIDHMLPSQKRRSKASALKSSKRRRVGSTTISRDRSGVYSHQPKITEHLKQPRKSTKSTKSTRIRKSSFGDPNRVTVNRSKKSPPPRLSILDVTSISSRSRLDIPQFVRIAARTARSKVGQGRQSPSKKFIRLANRGDTFDAQSVLEDWKDGKIQPRNINSLQESSAKPLRPPLGPIASNQQTKFQTPGQTRRPNHAPTGRMELPRKLVVSKGKQTSMNEFVTSEEPTIAHYKGLHVEKRVWEHPQKRTNRPHRIGPSARPAQLEASEIEYSRQNPSSAFRCTKKTLDAIYRTTRKRRRPQDNLQLGRFLADDDAVEPPIETLGDREDDPEPTAKQALNQLRRKKRQPERVDVGAARYRQPSEPLILEFLTPVPLQDIPGEVSKLQGLGKFGTKYSLHFDIFPLQSGIYFHEGTLIGSGRLSKAVNGAVIQVGLVRQYTSLRLGDKDFQWGPWNPTVSSEIGVCFDWLLDQVLSSSPISTPPTIDTVSIMTFVVDYVQNCLSFTDFDQQTDFLTRIIEVLEEFSSRVKGQLSTSQHASPQWIGTLNRCMLVGLYVIRIARTRPENASLAFKAEDVLKSTTSICVGQLLSDGIDGIRKLYDDLQYLSFRERGIRNDQYAIQSWVIAMQVLDAARIPRGTFWDVVNSVLVSAEAKNTNDARTMEKSWYTMFSLLPLCEFDDFGFIKPGRRRKASFDNWSLPQQMLKRVFALYGSNPRQSPGFNDYCRALVSRCHHLISVWAWWKCSGIIGAIFDFFASQKLGHLRNEEVYDSPRFLRELGKEPSLEVDSEDRCFHIFLKVVGLAIKHMEKEKDIKGIRNLVARLLPNHDRQYPKEEAIHQRELASLRNHHDLLCTLYWAAPIEQRPAPALIQELVIADRSHKEACLINLRAWENLARFVVTNSSNPDTYQPFALWQNEFSSKLAQQYIGTEFEVRHQAEVLEKSDTTPISEALLKQTILANRRSTMETLRVMVRIMDHTVKAATSAQLAIQAFNPELLRIACRPDSWGEDDFSEGMLQDCVDSISHYIEQVDRLEPNYPSQSNSTYATDSESQGSLEMDLNMERVEMIYRLQPEILPLLRSATRRGLQIQLPNSSDPSLLSDLVLCWSSLVLKLTESAMNLGDFLVKGPNAIFQQRSLSNKSNAYWPLFLGELLRHKDLDDFKVPGFDIGLEWLLAISKPQSQIPLTLDMVNTLTTRLQSKDHYLLIWPHRNASGVIHSGEIGENTLPNHTLIKTAVDVMRATLLSQANVDAVFANKSQREARAIFSAMLKEVMESIKQHLEAMAPGSNEHKEYVGFVQLVISIIRSYASDIRPPIDFFSHPSAHYWPEEADPSLYAAGIISYSLGLIENPRKTSPILFHYLYNGWRKDLIQGQIGKHMGYVKKGMKRSEFTTFLMAELMPAALHVGFHSTGGWVLCATYLPVLSKRIVNILQKSDLEAVSTFGHLVNILRIMLNGISTRYGFNGVDPMYRAIVSTACQFWLSVALPMRQYTQSDSEAGKLMNEVTAPLTRFILQACQPWEDGIGAGLWEIEQLEAENGHHIENFVSILTQDLNDRWEVDWHDMRADIGGTGAHEGSRTRVDFKQVVGAPPPLLQLLELVLPTLETTVEEMIPPALLRCTDRLLQDVYL